MKAIKKIIKKIAEILKNSKIKRIIKYLLKHIDEIEEHLDILLKKEKEDNGKS